MTRSTQPLLAAMTHWFAGDPRRVHHFLKVWAFARTIGQSEGLDGGADYQILIEADFLVNAYEDGMRPAAVATVKRKIFRTRLGTELLETMYPAKE